MEPLQPTESESILERIRELSLRDDLPITANAALNVLTNKTVFTADDIWFLERVDEWSIKNRISRLQECDLDPGDDVFLEFLQRRTCFTPRQYEALATLEAVYGVKSERIS